MPRLHRDAAGLRRRCQGEAAEGQLGHKGKANRTNAVAIVAGNAANGCFVIRRERIVRSRVVHTMSRRHVDLFSKINSSHTASRSTYDWYPARTRIGFIAGRTDPDFMIKIFNAILFVKKATLDPCVQIAHVKVLEKSIRCHLSSLKSTRFPQDSSLICTRICSMVPCQNDSCCAASKTTPITGPTTETPTTPRTTSTTLPSTWTVDRCPLILSSQISPAICR